MKSSTLAQVVRRAALALVLVTIAARAYRLPEPSEASIATAVVSVVPMPRSATIGVGVFVWPRTIRLAMPSATQGYATQRLLSSLGPEVRVLWNDPRGADVTFAGPGSADADLGPEGYAIDVSPTAVRIAANTPAGFLYAVETLDQLTEREGAAAPRTRAITVRDRPTYAWRGLHLDVSRHFFRLPTLLRYIDVAARYKLNILHLHLTDNEGWRIPIPAYPRLTSIGACDATGANCGAYSRADLRRLVAYAAERNVTLVPEVDTPGHAGAAIRAYPELGCAPSGHTLCPSAASFAFLKAVNDELVAIFPGPYVHIGGDEVDATDWRASAVATTFLRRERLTSYADVQSAFTRYAGRTAMAHGRTPVAWDDVLVSAADQRIMILAWRGQAALLLAVRRGHDSVANFDGPLYFDGYQGDEDQEPAAMRYHSTLEQVYQFDPTPTSLSPEERQHIVGIQADLWTEQIDSERQLFYMLLPRALALSEVAWTPRERRSWDSFERRLPRQYAWLEQRGLAFRLPEPSFTASGASFAFRGTGTGSQTAIVSTPATRFRLAMTAPINAPVRYTIDDDAPSAGSSLYRAPLDLRLRDGQVIDVKAAAFLGGRRGPVERLLIHKGDAPIAGDFQTWRQLQLSRGPDVYVPPRFP